MEAWQRQRDALVEFRADEETDSAESESEGGPLQGRAAEDAQAVVYGGQGN